MRQAIPILGSVALGTALLLCLGGTTSAKPPEPAPSCGQRGRVVFDKDTTLADASGRKLLRFSGGESAVTLLAPPSPGSELARIETGNGRGSFRIPGFVNARELRIYAGQPLPVVSGHVSIASGTRVTLAGGSGGKVRLEKQLGAPFEQRVSALAECGAVTFTAPSPAVAPTPANARVFLLKEPRLELYDSVPPVGDAIFTLERSPTVPSARFFSREQRGGFVHVQYEGEILVDAWARAGNLEPLPRGETSDVPAGSYTLSSAPQLQLSELPRVVKTSREVPLRLAAKDSESPVGVIETDTEVYVMDVIASWTKVLPKSLHVLPIGDGSFWVKTAELGL